MKCTILGCGGSLGVPEILCNCYVCQSTNPKNIRKRASIYLQSETTNILVDTSQDFKFQAITYGIKDIDAVLYTHSHSDHIAGINDLKPYVFKSGNKISTYLDEITFNNIYKAYAYLFDSRNSNIYQPVLNANIIDQYSNFMIGDIKVSSFLQNHGEIDSLGFRFGKFAYSTDLNNLPIKSLEILKGVEIWVIGCLRYSWSPSHLSLEQALDYIDIVKPNRAILTHMAHDIDFNEINQILPPNVEAAFDGLVINV